VRSSKGLAVSMFLRVLSRSFSSASTLALVSSALLRAVASYASMALIWRPTSYFLTWKLVNCFSMSSMMAVFLRTER
jgi:hypothetical protein